MKHATVLELVGVGRRFDSDGGTVRALQGIDLRIDAGEMVAIMGVSGSGKSTLMNILGCLDVPTEGAYLIDGRNTAELDADALAAMRRERFGFVFQRYHLLTHLSALANVEVPAIYSALPVEARRQRAHDLLAQLGLADRAMHRPNALSGGQQQRVSIARALMNGGEIVLADEPTGALDSASGQEMMAVLQELHVQGHTVILITHDAQVAVHAQRVIELRDGRIVRDTGWPAGLARATFDAAERPRSSGWSGLRRRAAQFIDATGMALAALRGHRLRSALSVLGISIGIAALVSIVGLSDAARVAVDTQLRGLLSGRLMVFRGSPVLPTGTHLLSFRPKDVEALRAVPGVQSVLPVLDLAMTARHDNRYSHLSVLGIGSGELPQYGVKLIEGRELSALDVGLRAQVVVIDRKSRNRLFSPGMPVLGQTVHIGPLPFAVVGVAAQGEGAFDVKDWRDRFFVPATTFADKLSGPIDVDRLNVYLTGDVPPQQVQAAMSGVLKVMHGQEDFTINSLDTAFRTIDQVTLVIKLVLSAIAGISLLVGGVGVMNIMLVAVAERTPEIGIRMAVGARPSDVQTQFMIEAVVLCATGGLVGTTVSWISALVANAVQQGLHVVVSWAALALAFGVASAIGVTFGFLPARKASLLSPVEALARE